MLPSAWYQSTDFSVPDLLFAQDLELALLCMSNYTNSFDTEILHWKSAYFDIYSNILFQYFALFPISCLTSKAWLSFSTALATGCAVSRIHKFDNRILNGTVSVSVSTEVPDSGCQWLWYSHVKREHPMQGCKRAVCVSVLTNLRSHSSLAFTGSGRDTYIRK